FNQGNGLAEGTHVHVWGNERFDKWSAAGFAAARHLLDEDVSSGFDAVPQHRHIRGIVALAYVLAHFDGGHGVVLAARGRHGVAIVGAADVDYVSDAALVDATRDELCLLARNRHG